MMITPGQIRAVMSLWKHTYDDEEAFRDALENSYGERSVRMLSKAQAHAVIELLVKNAPPRARYRGSGKRGFNRRITPARAERIGILQDILSWNNAGLLSFIERQTGKKKSGWLVDGCAGGKGDCWYATGFVWWVSGTL